MTEPRVAICVVTFNSGPLIRDLVASLPEGASGTDWMLVFADNDSTDNTLDEIAHWADESRIIKTGANRGYGAGVNAAIVAAGVQDAYLILNADVRLAPGCVRKLFDALGPDVGVAVPKLLDARGELIWSMRREPSVLRAWADALVGAERVGRVPLLGEMVTDPRRYHRPGPTDWAEGSTQLLSAACVQKCGQWDEAFFLYSEETEYDLRARDHGFRTWFEPAAVASHLEGGSAGSPRQWALLVVNRVRLFRMRHGRIPTALFWMATVMREASRGALGRRTSRAALQDLISPRRLRASRSPEWLAGVRL